MSRFVGRFSLQTKLVTGFTVVLMTTVGLGLFTIRSMSQMDEAAEVVRTNYLPSLMAVGELTSLAQKLRLRESQYFLATDPAERQAYAKSMDDLLASFRNKRAAYDALIDAGDEAEHYQRFDALWSQYVTMHQQLLATSFKNDKEDATVLFEDGMSTEFDKMSDILDWDMGYNRSHGVKAAEQVSENYINTRSVTEVIIALAAAVTALVGYTLVRSISIPLASLAGVMRRLADHDVTVAIPGADRADEIGGMAAAVQVFKDAGLEKFRLEIEAKEQRRLTDEERQRHEQARTETAQAQANVMAAMRVGLEHLSVGNLTYRIEQAFLPEYEQLRADFNLAVDQLQAAMRAIVGNVQGIRSGTDEISHAANDLSRRTEQQAAALEETAAALDQITATIHKTAERAKQAREVVVRTKSDAERSGEVVRQAVTAMAEIEASSRHVGQIIGVIDEIAFQTNLLALNAGVEAARAGDSGRGFAVVASEVRALAQRSAEAAKEIKTLISESTLQVGSGVKHVGETGEALSRIVAEVTKVSDLVGEIASSAQEQATGLAEVNTAVNQMDQVTQQNAAMVEESTAATTSLAQETQELGRLIQGFQLRQGERDAPVSNIEPLRRPPASKPAMLPNGATALKVVGRSGRSRDNATPLKPASVKMVVAGTDEWEAF